MYHKRKEKVKVEKYTEFLTQHSEITTRTKDSFSSSTKAEITNPKISLFFRIRRFWFGMIKESKRIFWAKPKELGIGIMTVLIVAAVLGSIFFGITELIILTGIVF